MSFPLSILSKGKSTLPLNHENFTPSFPNFMNLKTSQINVFWSLTNSKVDLGETLPHGIIHRTECE